MALFLLQTQLARYAERTRMVTATPNVGPISVRRVWRPTLGGTDATSVFA
jgi:hypothetical protein